MKERRNRRIRVAVLCGGDSPEREVSLRSGERIASALRRRGYLVATVDPSAEYTEREMQFTAVPFRKRPCRARKNRRGIPRACERHGNSPHFTLSAALFCKKSDAVFLALHGGAGEDGRIAAALECMGIPHTGSDHKGLCLSMDKLISKRLMTEAGIPTPEYVLLPSQNDSKTANYGDLPRDCPFPCVVKPISGGSSIGVKMIDSPEELTAFLTDRKSKTDGIIIERRIIGREFTVGVLNGEALAVTEIIPKEGFYDYNNKYTKGATDEITPAHIDKETEAAIQTAALNTHKALCLGAYSRIDIMLCAETNKVYVLEANAIPGMTATSLLPQGAAAVGIDFDTLCEKILNTAL